MLDLDRYFILNKEKNNCSLIENNFIKSNVNCYVGTEKSNCCYTNDAILIAKKG